MNKVVTGILLLFSVNCFSQSLLVNGGFEDENTCTEYKVQCAPSGWVSTNNPFTNYIKEPSFPFEGTHCVSVIAGRTNRNYYRTHLRSQLICGLRKGGTYQLQFYIKSPHPILDSFGVLFTSYDFLFDKNKVQDLVPTVYLKDATQKPVKGNKDWQKIIINYIAEGDESFITLGYFSPNDLNSITGIDKESHFFIYLDNISLKPLREGEGICNDYEKNIKEIYSQHDRHEYIVRIVNQNKYKPLKEIVVQKTTETKIDSFILADVFFATGEATLKTESFKVLDSICKVVSGKKIDSVFVDGFTDSTGSDRLNLKLSTGRAGNVAAYISKKLSFSPDFVQATGFGSLYPLDTNGTPEGRQQNRRVEIYFYIRE